MVGAVVIPLRTRSTLNQREHWAKRARRTKRERGVVGLMLRAELGRVVWLDDDGGAVVVQLKRIAPRKLDDDNLRGALKAVRDEVAAFLGVDDGDARVEWAYDQARGAAHEYGVEIRFEERA